jgi:hypothetical protein
MVPQPPQFAMSAPRSTQRRSSGQNTVPFPHDDTQRLCWQMPLEQAEPQLPQFTTSFWTSTHAPPQCVVPPAHWSEQVPREQTRPPLHRFAHAPQLSGSESTWTHSPAHGRAREPHASPSDAIL